MRIINEPIPYDEAVQEMYNLGGRVVVGGRIAVGEEQLKTVYSHLGWNHDGTKKADAKPATKADGAK